SSRRRHTRCSGDWSSDVCSSDLSTLSQLLQLEALISLGVVLGTALLAFVIIEVGLRPLRRMGVVAGDIAAGDLSRRVEPATPKKIGRASWRERRAGGRVRETVQK